MTIPATITVALVCFPLCAGAQLASDRPSFGSTATTVEPGHVMFEFGYTLTPTDQTLQHSIGEVDIRIGIVQHVELIAGLNSFELEDSDGQVTSTWKGPKAGARVRILQREAGSGMPTTGVLVTVIVPVNENTKKLVPEFRALFDWDFGVVIGVNLLVRTVSSNNGRFTQWGGSAGVGGELARRLGWYGELVLVTPRVLDGRDAGKAGGGLLFFLNDNMQLDAKVELGVYGGEPDVALGFGASLRL